MGGDHFWLRKPCWCIWGIHCCYPSLNKASPATTECSQTRCCWNLTSGRGASSESTSCRAVDATSQAWPAGSPTSQSATACSLWLACTSQNHHLIQPSHSFLIQSKNAAPSNQPADFLNQEYYPQQLNAEQRRIYDHVQGHTINPEADPLALLVLGTAGTGKSYLINCLRQLMGQTVTLLAPTGVAAVNIGGATLQSHLLFPNVHSFAQLRGPSLPKIQEKIILCHSVCHHRWSVHDWL